FDCRRIYRIAERRHRRAGPFATAVRLPRGLRTVAELVSGPPWSCSRSLACRRDGCRDQSWNHFDRVWAGHVCRRRQMSLFGSVSAGIQDALLLARGRPDGIQLVDTDHTAAIRSFWAIPLCLPAVVCLKLLDWLASGIPANVPLALGRYLLLFLVGWLLFVWISHHFASVLNKQSHWPRFIAVWSYCSVIENTLVAIGGLPGVLGAPS